MLALGSLLAACTLAPPVEVPVAQAPSAASPAAAATATPTPAPSPAATAVPASPAPSATPYQWQPTGVEPVRDQPDYQEAAFGLTIQDTQYAVTGDAGSGYTAQASMVVKVAGRPTTTITFEEFDGPDTGEPSDQDDHVTITDTTTGDTRTFGADQGLVNLWVGTDPGSLVAYRVQQESDSRPRFSFYDFGLYVQFLGGGMYLVNGYPCPMPLTDAAMAAAHSPQLNEASLASLSALYAVLRDRPFNDDSVGLESFYRVRQGLTPAGTRVVMPPRVRDYKKGSGFGRYGVMSASETAQNPAAALLRAVIDLRMRDDFDPMGEYEAMACEPLVDEPRPL